MPDTRHHDGRVLLGDPADGRARVGLVFQHTEPMCVVDFALRYRGAAAHIAAHVFARLHESRWVEGAGAFLTLAEVDRIFACLVPRGGSSHVVGLDIGLTRDRTVAAVAHRDGPDVMADLFRSWTGRAGSPVDLGKVLDPPQAVLLGQRLHAAGVAVEEHPFTSESRRRLFGVVLQLVRDGRLHAAPHDAFRRELLGLEVSDTAAGWCMDHRPGRHDDFVVALALAAQRLISHPGIAWAM